MQDARFAGSGCRAHAEPPGRLSVWRVDPRDLACNAEVQVFVRSQRVSPFWVLVACRRVLLGRIGVALVSQ